MEVICRDKDIICSCYKNICVSQYMCSPRCPCTRELQQHFVVFELWQAQSQYDHNWLDWIICLLTLGPKPANLLNCQMGRVKLFSTAIKTKIISPESSPKHTHGHHSWGRLQVSGKMSPRASFLPSQFLCCWHMLVRETGCCYCISRTALHLETSVAQGESVIAGR